MGTLIEHHGIQPVLHPPVFLAEGVHIIGDVTLGADSSVWFNTIIRGDVNRIRIGSRTNIQDLCVVHVTSDTHPTTIGDDVTIGHRVIVHGCRIGNRCLIGMGAILMDGAEVGEESLIGAGALVSPGTKIPPRTLALGQPARVKRELKAEEIALLKVSADHYVKNSQTYLRQAPRRS